MAAGSITGSLNKRLRAIQLYEAMKTEKFLEAPALPNLFIVVRASPLMWLCQLRSGFV